MLNQISPPIKMHRSSNLWLSGEQVILKEEGGALQHCCQVEQTSRYGMQHETQEALVSLLAY